MKRILEYIKNHKYYLVVSILVFTSIVLSVTYSNYFVSSGNHRVAEMYIGSLKYSISIDNNETNTLTLEPGETIIDIDVNNLNPVDTYYKLLYLNNSNLTINYYSQTKDTSDTVTKYNKPNDSITSSGTNNIKLSIVNNSSSNQTISFSLKGGYINNTLSDIKVPSGYNEINKEDVSTNTYFCKTSDTLTQGLEYVNGQYTYGYKKEGKSSSSLAWNNMSNNGWGVQLTNKTSTEVVNSKLCAYINNKPVVSMSYMFYKSKATTLDLSHFDTSNVTNMGYMFNNSQATTLDLSNFDTSKVTNMSYMFYNSQATEINLNNINTSNAINMSSMFDYSEATTIKGLENFNTSKVTDMSYMFDCSKAKTLNLSSFDTSNVTNMNAMFQSSEATTVDVSSFNTSKVTNMNYMFSGSEATTLDVSNFDTSNVIKMEAMFQGSKATVIDVSGFNTSKVTSMEAMFRNSIIDTLDLSNFDTRNVTSMESMFHNLKVTSLDLTSFNTSKVTTMESMFYGMTNLKTIYVTNNFNTSLVTISDYMFNGCTKLVGGSGTKYSSSHIDKTYARIDGGTSSPGYFTEAEIKISAPESFMFDSWETIINAVKNNNTSKYSVGDTKYIELDDYGVFEVRIANMSTPSECNQDSFSQSACGFVVEFLDSISSPDDLDGSSTIGGWPSSDMYKFLNNDIYNALPSELKTGIKSTKVISGHGSSDTDNFISNDKIYLFSVKELYGDINNSDIFYDTSDSFTRQLDYYANEGANWDLRASVCTNKSTNSFLLRSISFDSDIDYAIIDSDCLIIKTYGTSLGGPFTPVFRIG